MQVVKRIGIGIVVVLLSVVIFAPKDRLFFLLEQSLEQNDVVISKELVDNGVFGVDIDNAHISIKGVTMAKIGRIDISSLILFSSIDISNVALDETSKAMIPLSEFNLSISHSLFAPKTLGLSLSHQGIEVQATLRFMDEGVVRIEMEDINGSDWLKPMMQKDENGWYYETAI
jgi:hypothetical protein